MKVKKALVQFLAIYFESNIVNMLKSMYKVNYVGVTNLLLTTNVCFFVYKIIL